MIEAAPSNSSIQKCLSNKITEHLSKTKPCATSEKSYNNNNEMNGTSAAIEIISKNIDGDEAYGDYNKLELTNDQEKSKQLFANKHQEHSDSSPEHTDIPRICSSSIVYSTKMMIQCKDKQDDAIQLDQKNDDSHIYCISSFHQISKDNTELADVSVQRKEHQKILVDRCECEIDLGSGRITKSISNYQSDDKKQPRAISIVSADSVQPITTPKVPFANQYYTNHMYPKQESLTVGYDDPNILFRAHNLATQNKFNFPSKTVTLLCVGASIIIFMIVLTVLIF